MFGCISVYDMCMFFSLSHLKAKFCRKINIWEKILNRVVMIFNIVLHFYLQAVFSAF